MNRIRTVFWDLDGTIADTELFAHRLAFNKAFQEFNLDWNWDIPTYIELLSISGGTNRIFHYSSSLHKQISKQKAFDIHKKKQSIYIDIIQNGSINKRNGVDRLINELYLNNVNQWIVTTSSITTTSTLISHLFSNYKKIFSGFITSEDVNDLKPSPEAYELALSRSHSSVMNSIVIEDSLIGLHSAKAAGLKCIVSLSPWLNNTSDEFSIAELVVDHLGDNDLPSIALIGNLKESVVNLNLINNLIN